MPSTAQFILNRLTEWEAVGATAAAVAMAVWARGQA
jgi:hypothetical protein